MFNAFSAASPFWEILTRLGEAEILLPVAVLTAAAWCCKADRRRLGLVWMLLIGLAIAITAATKIAFIGWGIGVAALNFTGISGHAMFASAIYPLLLVAFAPASSALPRQRALALGVGLAVLIGISRIVVGAHSWSEVLAGWALGGAVSALVLGYPVLTSAFLRPLVPALLLAWVSITPFGMPGSQTHSLITRVALQLSGHTIPYTRADLLLR